jgi:ribonuclease G
VINQTEALVAIDVNTGKYVGKTNRLEDTIVKTNTEAIKEIVRQIRLRDLGGIIVIDFIDMDERKNRQKVMQTLEEAMRVDRAPYKILQFNDFGLVAITRKRVKQSLERTLCSPCPHCEGAGYIKSAQTVVSEILIEARKLARSIEGKDVLLRVHPDVGKVLKSNQNKFLEELEEVLRRPVLIKSDPQLHHEKFDLA